MRSDPLLRALGADPRALVDPAEWRVLAAHPHDDRSLLLAKLGAVGQSLAVLTAILFVPPAFVALLRWGPAMALAFLAGAAGAVVTVAIGSLLLAMLIVRLGGRRSLERLLPWIQVTFRFGFFVPMAFNQLLQPEQATAGSLGWLFWLLPTFWFDAPLELVAGGAGAPAAGRRPPAAWRWRLAASFSSSSPASTWPAAWAANARTSAATDRDTSAWSVGPAISGPPPAFREPASLQPAAGAPALRLAHPFRSARPAHPGRGHAVRFARGSSHRGCHGSLSVRLDAVRERQHPHPQPAPREPVVEPLQPGRPHPFLAGHDRVAALPDARPAGHRAGPGRPAPLGGGRRPLAASPPRLAPAGRLRRSPLVLGKGVFPEFPFSELSSNDGAGA